MSTGGALEPKFELFPRGRGLRSRSGYWGRHVLKRSWGSYFCHLVVIILIGQAPTQPALAGDVVEAVMEIVGCAPLKDDKDRLSCFDKAAVSLKTAGVPSGPETANTKELVASFSPSDFKIADPDDIHVAPRKFIGK